MRFAGMPSTGRKPARAKLSDGTARAAKKKRAEKERGGPARPGPTAILRQSARRAWPGTAKNAAVRPAWASAAVQPASLGLSVYTPVSDAWASTWPSMARLTSPPVNAPSTGSVSTSSAYSVNT